MYGINGEVYDYEKGTISSGKRVSREDRDLKDTVISSEGPLVPL